MRFDATEPPDSFLQKNLTIKRNRVLRPFPEEKGTSDGARVHPQRLKRRPAFFEITSEFCLTLSGIFCTIKSNKPSS